MKKFATLCAVFFLAALILLPAPSNGKFNVSKPAVADGYMLPPFLPSFLAIAQADTLVADGTPIPPFPPKPPTTLVADGTPIPPFPPNPSTELSVQS